MRPDISPPTRDEPAVTSPELRELVDAARTTPTRPVEISAAQVHRAFLEHRADRRRQLVTGSLAAAACVALVFFGTKMLGPRADSPRVDAEKVAAIEPAAPAPSDPGADRVAAAPALADDIRVVARGSGAPEILGPRELRLASGTYEIASGAEAGEPAVIWLPAGFVELEVGLILIVLDGPRAVLRLEHGRATRVDEDGTRTPLTAQSEQDPVRSARDRSPARLAERAEVLQRRGDRKEAIAVLGRIVRDHPNAPIARGATLDLARLLKAAGRTDEARCAYALYLKRWPHTRLRPDVERALARLGPGLECDDLEPR